MARNGRPFLLGAADEPVFYCIKTATNGAEVKHEFRQRGMECVNTWKSPSGSYPGLPECRPDGKAPECPVPPPPPQMAGRRRSLGQGAGNTCKIPGTDLRATFDMNWEGGGACGLSWVDQSEDPVPDCVQAPAGYPGQPAQGGWIPQSCTIVQPPAPVPTPAPAPVPTPTPAPAPTPDPGAKTPPVTCPPGQFAGANGICVDVSNISNVNTGQGCPEGQVLNYEQKCVPGNFSACRNSDGSWRLFWQGTDEYYGNVPNEYANGVNFPAGVVASIAHNPGASSGYCDNHPIPTETAPTPPPPPTVPETAPFEPGPPVLPPPQYETVQMQPTGAYPGDPFPVQQPMKAITPAPRPEACPLGPIPVAKWAQDCAMSKLR